MLCTVSQAEIFLGSALPGVICRPFETLIKQYGMTVLGNTGSSTNDLDAAHCCQSANLVGTAAFPDGCPKSASPLPTPTPTFAIETGSMSS